MGSFFQELKRLEAIEIDNSLAAVFVQLELIVGFLAPQSRSAENL